MRWVRSTQVAWVPITQARASTRLDFPVPLGPTTTVTPGLALQAGPIGERLEADEGECLEMQGRAQAITGESHAWNSPADRRSASSPRSGVRRHLVERGHLGPRRPPAEPLHQRRQRPPRRPERAPRPGRRPGCGPSRPGPAALASARIDQRKPTPWTRPSTTKRRAPATTGLIAGTPGRRRRCGPAGRCARSPPRSAGKAPRPARRPPGAAGSRRPARRAAGRPGRPGWCRRGAAPACSTGRTARRRAATSSGDRDPAGRSGRTRARCSTSSA